MSYYVGRRGSLGVARESVRGTITAPTYWLPYNSISFDEKIVTIDQDSAFGQIADSDMSYVVKKYAEGDFEYDLEDTIIGTILSAVTGAAPVSAGSTNYTHTYTLANTNTHQSLSLLVQDPNIAKMFRLAMIDKFTIKVEPEGLVKCTCSFRSTSGRDWTITTPSYSTGNKFIHSMFTFKLATSTATLAAASGINLTNFEITISKNVQDFNDLGTATPSEILNKQLSIEGTFELGFNDATYRDYVSSGSTKAMEVKFTYGASNYLTIQLPKVRFANWEPNKGLNDIVTEKIEFKGLYDVANSANVISTLTLANQVSSY
jgi:hypothetical protein